MTWQDRLQGAVIITGDKKTFEVEMKRVSTDRSDRATIFSYSEFSGDFVQKLSSGGDSIPLTIWFSGPDHDLIANDFEESTKDIRPITFIHPLKPKPLLCQILKLKRNDDLVNAANETSFNITMHTTIERERPKTDLNESVVIENLSLNASNESAETMESVVEIKTASSTNLGDQATVVPFGLDDNIFPLTETKIELNNVIELVSGFINMYYSTALDILAEAQSVKLSAISLIATLENVPKQASLVVRGFVSLIGRTGNNPDLASPVSKSRYYSDVRASIVLNDITNYELLYPAIIIGLSQSVVNSNVKDFNTRAEVFEIIDNLFLWSIEFFSRIDAVIASDELNSYRPNLEAIRNMVDIVAMAAASLEEIIFQLKQERSVVVNRIKDLYTLSYELYGPPTVDELETNFNEIIAINKIKGTKIFNLEQGTEIIYYS